MKAVLRNYRQSPRKVRLVAGLVRGKSLTEALTILKFTVKRASDPLAKLIVSAAANAKKQGENPDTLFVRSIEVNDGVTLHRSMPRARGSAFPIRKRSSHVTVTLGTRSERRLKATS